MLRTTAPPLGRVYPNSAVPLYVQVKNILREEALATLGQDTPLPSELALVQCFGISRGTIRQVMLELERDGILYRPQGRGTCVRLAAQVRVMISVRLKEVARPDARFHFDVTRFIPDDEHLTAYSADETISMRFPNPYIRNAPTTVHVQEMDGTAERIVTPSYDEAFRLEWRHFYECLMNGTEPITNAQGAREDIAWLRDLVRAGINAQNSTAHAITRTPPTPP